MLFFAFKPCLNTVYHQYSTHRIWSLQGHAVLVRTFVRAVNGHARRKEKWTTSETRNNDNTIKWMALYFHENYWYAPVPLFILLWLRYLTVCTLLFLLWYHWFFIYFWNTTQISNLLLNSLMTLVPAPLTFTLHLFIAFNWAIIGYSQWFMDSLEEAVRKVRNVP